MCDLRTARDIFQAQRGKIYEECSEASESWKCGQGNPPVKQSKNAEMTCAMAYAMILPVHINCAWASFRPTLQGLCDVHNTQKVLAVRRVRTCSDIGGGIERGMGHMHKKNTKMFMLSAC
jgi:hypothetical protein